MLAMIALVALGVSAGTVTMVSPATSGLITGVYILNASADFNATWCAFYASSSDTANSSSTLVLRNATHNYDLINNSVNASFDSRILEDANTYSVTSTCGNQSGTTYDATASTSVIIDNTVPALPTVNTVNGYTDDDGSLNFNATVLTNQTTACTLRFLGTVPVGVGSSITITESSGLCTRVVSGPVGNGVFRYTFTATDGRNTTAETAAQDMIVTLDGNRKKSILVPTETAAELGAAPKKLSGTPLMILLGAGLLIVWQLTKKK